MSVLVMIYGQSGTGKSTSLRNFSRDDVAIVNVSGKPLPFRNNLKTYKSDNYHQIMKAIQAAPQKSIVIDDATYLMVNEFMRTAKQTGYQKYTDMACSFNSLIEFAASFSFGSGPSLSNRNSFASSPKNSGVATPNFMAVL